MARCPTILNAVRSGFSSSGTAATTPCTTICSPFRSRGIGLRSWHIPSRHFSKRDCGGALAWPCNGQLWKNRLGYLDYDFGSGKNAVDDVAVDVGEAHVAA